MSNSDQQKLSEKSGKRKQKRAKKPEQPKSTPEQVQVEAKREPIEAAVAPKVLEEAVESAAAVESGAAIEAAPAEPVERVASFKERMASVMPPADAAPGNPSAPADIAKAVPPPAAAPTAGIEALANAYRDYTKKSLQDAQTFAEKLSAARSFDKAVEAQTEFAKKACETFVVDSRKIRELHRELFWQTFRLPKWPLGRT